MIRTIDIEVNAANPNLPLKAIQAYVNSPISVRVRNVPRAVGNWKLSKVYLTANHPDNASRSVECKLVGGIWVGTLAASTAVGLSTNGFAVTASGTDESGNAITGYVLGKGDEIILTTDGTITVGETTYYVHILDAQPTVPKKGDLCLISNAWKIYNGSEWVAFGGGTGDICHTDFTNVTTLGERFTLNEVKGKVNEVLNILKGVTACVALMLGLTASAAVQTATLGELYNDSLVVTNVTGDSSITTNDVKSIVTSYGYATTNDVDVAVSNKMDALNYSVVIPASDWYFETTNSTWNYTDDPFTKYNLHIELLSQPQRVGSYEPPEYGAYVRCVSEGYFDRTINGSFVSVSSGDYLTDYGNAFEYEGRMAQVHLKNLIRVLPKTDTVIVSSTILTNVTSSVTNLVTSKGIYDAIVSATNGLVFTADDKRDLTNNVCVADSFSPWRATLPAAPSGEWESQPTYDTDNSEWRWYYTDWYAEGDNTDPNATSATFSFTVAGETTTFPATRSPVALSNDTFTTYAFVTNAVANAGDSTTVSALVTTTATHTASIAEWESYWTGENVRLSVTNYYGNTSGEPPRLRIEELDHKVTNTVDGVESVSNVYKVVWDEVTRQTNYYSRYSAQVESISNSTLVAAYKQTYNQLANKAPRAWGEVTSAGEKAPANTVWHTAPQTVFAGGTEYAHVAVGEGEICVLVDKGAPVYTSGAEGQFRFTDESGQYYFGFDVTDGYTIGCRTDGITVTSTNLVFLTYDLTSSTDPTILYATNLTDGVWLTADVTWETNPPAGQKIAYVNNQGRTQGYYKASLSVASEAKFVTNMQADLAGGIAASNETLNVIQNVYPVITSTGVVWRVKQ